MVNYLIWSNEHRAWWRPNAKGYTVHIKTAGRYTFAKRRWRIACAAISSVNRFQNSRFLRRTCWRLRGLSRQIALPKRHRQESNNGHGA